MSPLGFFELVIVVIIFAGSFGGVLNYLLNKKDAPEDPGFWPNLVLGIGAAILVPLFLHVIGSDLVTAMHEGSGGGPDYSKVLVFAGFCLVAAMSAKTFISSVSDRVLRRAERAEKLAGEAEQKAKRAQLVADRFIEPEPTAAVDMAETSAFSPSDKECKILRALTGTRYVLRTNNGLAVETKIERTITDSILNDLRKSKLVELTQFMRANEQNRDYWYITDEGRAVLNRCDDADQKAKTQPTS
jgi:hypothetical protein